MIFVPTIGTTTPREVIGYLDSSNILLKPVEAGPGVAAGGVVRIVMDMVGTTDVISKPLGSSAPTNVVGVTIDGSKELKTHEDILKLHELARSLQD